MYSCTGLKSSDKISPVFFNDATIFNATDISRRHRNAGVIINANVDIDANVFQ